MTPEQLIEQFSTELRALGPRGQLILEILELVTRHASAGDLRDSDVRTLARMLRQLADLEVPPGNN